MKNYRYNLFYLLVASLTMSIVLSACQLLPLNSITNPIVTEAHLTPIIEPNQTLEATSYSQEEMLTPTQAESPPETLAATPLSPTTTTSITSVSELPQLRYSSDLLYIANETLMRWDYVTGYSSILMENVRNYSVDRKGDKIALLRPLQVSANGVALYDLDIFNFQNKQLTNLLQDIAQLESLRISPDGKMLAYQTFSPVHTIKVMEVTDDSQSMELATYEKDEIPDLHWSPDSRYLLWEDGQGIWLGEPATLKTHFVISNTVEVEDPNGQLNSVEVTFDEIQWAPQGRYISLQIIPSDEGVRWYAVLDTKTSRLVRIPNTDEYNGKHTAVAWDQKGYLYVAFSPEMSSNSSSVIDVWRILATQNDLLIPEKKYVLPTFTFSNKEGDNKDDLEGTIHWLEPLSSNLIGLGVIFPEEINSGKLYLYDIDEGVLQDLIEIPADTQSIQWSPDGSGALIITSSKGLYFASINGTSLVDLAGMIGSNAFYFSWLPPIPRE